ncbi:MAG: glycosyltransferase [Alphaproteobacteria bacterium]|nr:glycosyltransferase [Alphaproteobacteria bacterium]
MSTIPASGHPEKAALFGLSQVPAVDPRIEISVVTPMFEEAGGAANLMREIASALAGRRFEIIAVDDASRDDTASRLLCAMADIPELRVLQHSRNAGQSRAVRTGVLAARGAIIVTLDGDGQNDPTDIPLLLKELEGAKAPLLKMAAGERAKRQDSFAKKAASRLANAIRSSLLGDGAADTGCGLKAFSREAYLRLPYFDHGHRYLPALMRREGFEVSYVRVSHRPRAHGGSKYTNFGRLAVAFRDMLGVMWLIGRARSPETVLELSQLVDRDTI